MRVPNIVSAAMLAVALALVSFAGARGADAQPLDPCRAPDEITGSISALPKVAAKVADPIKPGSTLRVLAVGSATMFGPDASLMPGTVTNQLLTRPSIPPTIPAASATPPLSSDAAFPMQMAAALQTAIPGLKVDVTLRGGRGLGASEMLDLIRKDLPDHHYDLVIWQTGTVEAVKNTPPGEFAQVLAEGAEAVEAAGADLILIDPQFSRFLQTNSNLDPYAQALQQTASMPGVLLFHRFDLMRAWANDGQIDLERTAKPDRRKTVELLHRCLGAHLARTIVAAART